MTKHLRYMAIAALAMAGTACNEGPADVNEEFEGELVITEGVAAPVIPVRPLFSGATASSNIGGSVTTPITLETTGCNSTQQVVITYTVTGAQEGTATFAVNTLWQYDGSHWAGSLPTTFSVAPRAGGRDAPPPAVFQATVTLTNASSVNTGISEMIISPSSVTNSNATGAKLTLTDESNARVFVQFAPCVGTNNAPILVVPGDFYAEATSALGASVAFAEMVTASDDEDGDLSAAVQCTPSSGSLFAFGPTVVSCSVTDAAGLSAQASFAITVRDITPPVFTAFPENTVELIAANINGAALDLDGLGITVADVNDVSTPVTFGCDKADGATLPIGLNVVSCTATDSRNNKSDPRAFSVIVGFNVNSSGLLPPLRSVAPFSVHKRGSTIPHKFLAPTYADGTPAIDLASGLNLRVSRIDGLVEVNGVEETVYSAGSTAWRYDSESGFYIFNLKTSTSFPWDAGTWTTKVSYAGITLAQTQFDLKK